MNKFLKFWWSWLWKDDATSSNELSETYDLNSSNTQSTSTSSSSTTSSLSSTSDNLHLKDIQPTNEQYLGISTIIAFEQNNHNFIRTDEQNEFTNISSLSPIDFPTHSNYIYNLSFNNYFTNFTTPLYNNNESIIVDDFGNNNSIISNDRPIEQLFPDILLNCTILNDCCIQNGKSSLTIVNWNGNITNCTTAVINGYDFNEALQFLEVLGTAIILGFIILSTVIGNVFVMAAIILERNLQNVANYLILSLAVADLLVACLVMPLSAVYEVSKEWKLGPELCDMWTSCDVLCCTASILHLVAIASDRYWAVTNVDYIHQRTAKRVCLIIFIIWFLASLVSIAPLLGWKDIKWERRVSVEFKCMVSQDISYQIFATASSFYVPLLIILILYWRIYQTARKRIRRRQQVKSGQGNSGPVANVAGGSGEIAAAVITVIGRPLPTISETTTAFTNLSSTHTSPEKNYYNNQIEYDPPTADVSTCSTVPVSIPKPKIIRKKTQTSMDSKRERKAAKTLAIITGVFVCCWLPFFILAILLPICQSCEISPLLMSLSLWLGYFNSTLNPIIYTIFSPEFRQAFKRILCGRKNSLRRNKCVH